MKNIYLWSLFLTLLAQTGYTSISYADPRWGHHEGHRYYRYHDHPHFGLHVSAFYPEEYYPIWVGGARYYYDDGLYYGYQGGDYVVVNPPMGAVVSTIPPDFQPIVINGNTYYTNNGTYYVSTPKGYEVVTTPVAQGAFTLNVPRDKGGYVMVTIKRSGNGFVGPQGEFYPEFPRVNQLQAMYGR